MLVSAIGASLVQTNGGTVTVKEMYWETSTGVSHGRYNNKEMQNGNFVELAKRGYVVVSIDMYGHGDSDYTTLETNFSSGTGMYDAVKLVADLPYVDATRIGVTGHSAGAFAVSYSVAIDNQADTRLIAAALLVDNDPTYTDEDGAYINAFEDRDAGIIAAQYDEFFFRSVGPDGKPTNAPRDFIGTPNAQSFLHYGTDPVIILTVSYQLFGKRNGQSLRLAGVLPGWMTVLRSLGLAAVVGASAFGIVFVLHYFFTTDFRVWVLAIRTFESDKLLIALAYLPFFLLYFVVNSILINGFNRITLRGKEWLNTAVLALANALGPIIVIVIQYVTFFSTGLPVQGLGPFSAMYVIWLFPVVVILIVSAIISRKIYRETGNPYIAGFINAGVATLISVSNSLTMAG